MGDGRARLWELEVIHTQKARCTTTRSGKEGECSLLVTRVVSCQGLSQPPGHRKRFSRGISRLCIRTGSPFARDTPCVKPGWWWARTDQHRRPEDLSRPRSRGQGRSSSSLTYFPRLRLLPCVCWYASLLEVPSLAPNPPPLSPLPYWPPSACRCGNWRGKRRQSPLKASGESPWALGSSSPATVAIGLSRH